MVACHLWGRLMFDLVVKNGTIVDGTGRAPFVGDLAISDGLLVQVGGTVTGEARETIDATGQTDEDAEVGDRLDGALNLVTLLVVHREVVPRIGLALLHTQGDTTTFFVDLEDHDFDFVAELDNLGRMNVLVGPVHFGNVNQAFDALFDFNE